MRTPATGPVGPSLLGELDVFLLNEGTHTRLGECLGAHLIEVGGVAGTWFAVWAPSATAVSVVGDWNGWQEGAAPLHARERSGIWERFLPGVGQGARYRYALRTPSGEVVEKIDPVACHHSQAPLHESIVWNLDYTWGDQAWTGARQGIDARRAPLSIYEVHLGSWRRVPEEGDRPLSYREIAGPLAEHARQLGFTHVELMPVMEHPFYGSWGYHVTGYFAPTSRYGTPQDLMALVDTLHQAGLGVIFDWVPAHFPRDDWALASYDGTYLYEHADPRQGQHPEWGSRIFNYGRHEVRAFLISSALHFAERFHADGLRVDGVASMLYLDYGRGNDPGGWVPNRHGGNENLEAVAFLRQLNDALAREVPHLVTIAEESTSWPMVTRATAAGGLGFGLKWDLGWMHDTLRHLARDPIHRRFHHGEMTFRGLYAFQEAYVLPLSHDEVVHGKGALLAKMHGDPWRRFAGMRLLLAWMWAQPGKKLLFMGGEFGQEREWNHDMSLDWHLLHQPAHAQLQLLVGELNRLHRETPALHQLDSDPRGFEWLEADDADQGVLAFLRLGEAGAAPVVCVFNTTPLPRKNYRVGVAQAGRYRELLNTDAHDFGGSGQGNLGGVTATPVGWKQRPLSLNLTVPPLGAVFLELVQP
ncbi:MAG: 1,4-alpha-glucan branching protein GlgB [Deltaproteobacteria bacterium]|nr:1,4-alpha-glucan branching protein GlgB [Deltaproteobacteria bacterium]